MDDEKLEWAKTLKPGDVVNDCRYLNMRIVSITPRVITEGWYGDENDEDMVPVEYREPVGTVFGFDAIFEDGHSCSILNCAEPAIPQKELEDQIKKYHPEEAEEIISRIKSNKFHVVL